MGQQYRLFINAGKVEWWVGTSGVENINKVELTSIIW